MTPDQLITFATVAEHRNISRAADALHLSQPAVSGQLRQLQDEFGEPLYQREGRGVRLTPTGEQLASYATRLRETWRQAHAFRNALRGLEQGTLRIGASTTPASYLLPYLIAAFHAHYPDVVLHARDGNTTEIVAGLAEFDVAVIEGPFGVELPPDTAIHAWHEDEIVAIVPRGHPLAQEAGDPQDARQAAGPRKGIELARLGAWPLVLREAGSGVRQIIERAFAGAAVPMKGAFEIAGVEGVKEAVRAGMGVGFVSAMSMRHEDATLCCLSLGPQPLTRRLSILVPHASAPSRVVRRFVEMCLADVEPQAAAGEADGPHRGGPAQ